MSELLDVVVVVPLIGFANVVGAENYFDRSNPYEFLSLVRELESPGEMNESKSYPFEFVNVDKEFETYTGINVKLR